MRLASFVDPSLGREARFGIVKSPPDVATTFDTTFAPKG